MTQDDAEVGLVEVGPYRIEKLLGSGGMGTVYRAYDQRLTRPVALKRLHLARSRQVGEHELLMREAKAIAQLSHPNVVQVYDVLEHSGSSWIVMELVEGRELRDVVRSESLGLRVILKYAIDIAKGLAVAHSRGIVHRDLKTENVMLTTEGRAKILDFGLARRSFLEHSSGVSADRIEGTPRSMAPEQALGRKIDHRADIFAFGVLLYECITRKSPFTEGVKGTFQVLAQVCQKRQKRLQDVSSRVPQELSDLVDRMLEKDPLDRPGSMEEVLLELQKISSEPRRRLSVLFVDDEPDVELMLKQWLRPRVESRQLEISFAEHGASALEILKQKPSIQLVFTDLNMPEMDGLTLISELTNLGRPCVSVVLSAYGDMSNIRSAMNLGAFDFLTKPIDFRDLETTLDKAAGHLDSVWEYRRLRAENELLEERNLVIRDAFVRYLQGDQGMKKVVEPLIEQLLEHSASWISVTLRVHPFKQLALAIEPLVLFNLIHLFLRDCVAQARLHHGTVLAVDEGIFTVGFGGLVPREIDGRHAKNCALDLQSLVMTFNELSRRHGGPDMSSEISIDANPTGAGAESVRLSSLDQNIKRWVRKYQDSVAEPTLSQGHLQCDTWQ